MITLISRYRIFALLFSCISAFLFAQSSNKNQNNQGCNLELNLVNSDEVAFLNYDGDTIAFSLPIIDLIDSICFNNEKSIWLDRTCVSEYYTKIKGNGRACKADEINKKILDLIKNKIGLDPKYNYEVVDTIIEWSFDIVDSSKFYACGIYFDYGLFNKLGIYTVDMRGSLKRFDNNNEFIYLNMDGSDEIVQVFNKINYKGYNTLEYIGDTLDFGFYCYIPPQILLNVESLKNLLLTQAGIDIQMKRKLHYVRYLYKNMSAVDRRKFYIQDAREIYDKFSNYTYPYNILHIYK